MKNLNDKNVKFIGTLGILCAMFVASVFIFDGFFGAGEPVAVASTDSTDVAIQPAPHTSIDAADDQDVIEQVAATTSTVTISESDFIKEAQSIIRRESDDSDLQLLEAKTVEIDAAMSQQDFRAEARNVLYRDEN